MSYRGCYWGSQNIVAAVGVAVVCDRWIHRDHSLRFHGSLLLHYWEVLPHMTCLKAARKHGQLLVHISVLIFGLQVGTLQLGGSPATFITALPVAQDQLLVRFSSDGTLSSCAAPLDCQLLDMQFPVTLFYGVTSKLALSLTAGETAGFFEQTPAQSGQPLNSSGLGDSQVFARYTLLGIDRPGSTFRIASFAGLYLPTGSYDEFGLLRAVRAGSGSVDPYFGVTGGWNTASYGLAWDGTYRHDPAASRGFTLGDEAEVDGEFEYRLTPRKLPAGLPGELWAVAEDNLIWDATNRIGGETANSTGGSLGIADAGLEYATLRWEIGAEVRAPEFQHLNGVQPLTEKLGFVAFFEYYLAMPSWRK